MSGPIGVLGATGVVGGAVVEMLRESGLDDLRLGARRAVAGGRVHVVDAQDPDSLAQFCAGVSVVVNCAGPSYVLLDTVARAAHRACADYVDVSDGPAYHLLHGDDRGERTSVLSAGMLPGLSNIVPRAIAPMGQLVGSRLTVHAGGIERFTPAAAGDLVLSVDGDDQSTYWYGEALAAWRDGAVESGALAAFDDQEVPHFPGRVSAMPFLTADSVRMARSDGLTALDWYNIFTGPQLRLALGRLRGRVSRDPEALAAAIADVRTAGEIDRAGQDPYYTMTYTLAGDAYARTAVLRTDSSFRLTASVAVLAVKSLLAGTVPPGLYFADEVLDPQATIQGVQDLGALEVFDVYDHVHPRPVMEEGTL